jgi:hypothetical protein
MSAADTLRGVQVMKVQVSKRRSIMIFLVAVLVTLALTNTAVAQEAAGFDGYIQSGTCAAPETEDPVRIDLEDGRQDYAVEPYLAKIEGSDGTVTIAYYGAPLAPGFSVATIYTDQAVFSLVITDPATGEPVACGDILEPDDDIYVEIGMALVQLLPVGDSGVQGYAVIERTPTERELDIISTQVRILLSTESAAPVPAAATPEATPAS